MNLVSRKTLVRVVALMSAVVVLSFASILLNGTLLFFPDVEQEGTLQEHFDGLVIGESELRRIDKQLVWVTYLSAAQINNLSQLTQTQVNQNSGCAITQRYCIVVAATQQSGINLQYTVSPPAQFLREMPWYGGYVNPINGAVYDLLGRAYLFQGAADPLVVINYSN